MIYWLELFTEAWFTQIRAVARDCFFLRSNTSEYIRTGHKLKLLLCNLLTRAYKGRPAARRLAVRRRNSRVCRSCPATTWSVCSASACSPRVARVPYATARRRFRRLFSGRTQASLPDRRTARGVQRASRWLRSIAGATASCPTSSANSRSTARSLPVCLRIIASFDQYLKVLLKVFIYCWIAIS